MVLNFIIFVIGFILGAIGMSFFAIKESDGVIVVDRSIPDEEPNVFLELKDGTLIDNECSVILRVEHRNYISHE